MCERKYSKTQSKRNIWSEKMIKHMVFQHQPSPAQPSQAKQAKPSQADINVMCKRHIFMSDINVKDSCQI